MSPIRSIARRVLHFVMRLAPPRTRSWGEAMIGEMDHIDDEWDALLWALGGTLALCRCSLIEHLKNFRNLLADEISARRKASHLIKSILTGVVAAADSDNPCRTARSSGGARDRSGRGSR